MKDGDNETSTVIHYPNFAIDETGEGDGLVYELRFQYLMEMLLYMIPKGKHYFFFDTPVTCDEMKRSLKGCDFCETNKVIVLSSIVENSKHTLKSQIHKPFSYNNIPTWYDADLAQTLNLYSTDGSTVFNVDDLEKLLSFMTVRHPQLRIKNGCGCAGENQVVISSLDDVVPVNVLWDMENCGIVVEKNLSEAKRTFSFSSFQLPRKDMTNETFISIGMIIDAERNTSGECTYRGTTCLVVRDTDVIRLSGFNIIDPLFGDMVMTKEEMSVITQFGQNVSLEYRKALKESHLPRVNLDIMLDDGKPVLIDASLRVGGNTWSEFRGAHRLRSDHLDVCLQSIRVLESNNERVSKKYEELGKLHVIFEGLDEFSNKIELFGIDH